MSALERSPAAVEALIAAGGPIFVRFSGGWCGACRATAPVFEAAARKYAARARFAEADVARMEELAQSCGVSRLPSVVFFTGGADETALAGRCAPAALERFIEGALASVRPTPDAR